MNDLQKAAPTETWTFPVEGGCILARAGVPRLFSLNQTAAILWDAYRCEGSPESAARKLVSTFGISYDLACEDTNRTLNDWFACGLLGPLQTFEPPPWDGRHGDPFTLAYCSIEGTVFHLLTDSQQAVREVLPRLAGILAAPCEPDVTVGIWSSRDDLFAIVMDNECVAMEQGVRAARALLFQELVGRAVRGRKWLALLHAAACGAGDSCILFPASSYSGKSTLTAALTAGGLTPYGDDFLGLIAGTLEIPAMPFAMAIRRGSWDVLQDWIPKLKDYPACDMHGEHLKFLPVAPPVSATPARATAIVFAAWKAHAELVKQPLTTAEVIARLSESGFWVRQDRASIAAFLAWLDRLPKYALQYSDLAQAVSHLRSLARATGSPSANPPHPHAPAQDGEPL